MAKFGLISIARIVFFHKQDGSVFDVFYWRQNSLICGPCNSQSQQIDCEDTRRWWWWCTVRWWQGWEKGVSAQIHEPRRQLHADPPLIRGSPQAHASAENSTILLTSQRNVTTNMKSDIGRKKEQLILNIFKWRCKFKSVIWFIEMFSLFAAEGMEIRTVQMFGNTVWSRRKSPKLLDCTKMHDIDDRYSWQRW